MKPITSFLVWVALASFPMDELAFGVAEGESTKKRFEARFQAGFDEVFLVGTDQGKVTERTMPMASSVERRRTTELTDVHESLANGRPLRARRTVDAATGVDVVSLPGQEPPPTERTSRLDATTILVSWNEDEEEFAFAPANGDDEELDPRLFATLRPDADFRFLLPPGEVDPGDEWTVDVEHVQDLVSPGGDHFPFLPPPEKPRAPEGTVEAQLSAPFAGMTIPLFQLLDEVRGEIQATFQGFDEEDERLALIAFELEVEGDLDPSERLDYHVARGMPEFIQYDYRHAVEFELSGQGVLRWNVAAGAFHDVQWGAELTGSEEIDLATKFDNPRTGEPVDVEMNIQADWEGTFRLEGEAVE